MIAVALKETNELIGEIIVKPKDNKISLGYTFSYKYHRQGYAFEALTVLHEHLHKMVPNGNMDYIDYDGNIARAYKNSGGIL